MQVLPFVFKPNKVNTFDNETRQQTLHRRGVETGATAEHSGQGATLFQHDPLQLGDEWRDDAIVPRSGHKKRSSLTGGRCWRGGDSRAAWLSAVVAGSGIPGPAGPRCVRL